MARFLIETRTAAPDASDVGAEDWCRSATSRMTSSITSSIGSARRVDRDGVARPDQRRRARVRSLRSRASSAVATSAIAAPVRPAACSGSCARRRARSSGEASRNILTSASGNTTVPMSRPSITTPPSRPSSRCCAMSDLAHARLPRHGGGGGVDLGRADRGRDVLAVDARRRRRRSRSRARRRPRRPRLVGEIDDLRAAPSTPPRDTSRRCRRAGSRDARRRRARPFPCPRPTVRRSR